MRVAAVTLVDTGPLVALLCARERHHDWVRTRFAAIEPPLLTCEAVLAETDHLVRRAGGDPGLAGDLIVRGVVRLGFDLASEAASVAAIQRRYREQPASLADACLVRMSEIHGSSRVLTFDADFRVYRRHRREAIPLWMPDA